MEDVDWGFSIDLFEISSFNQVHYAYLTISSIWSDKVGDWSKIKNVDLSLESNIVVYEGHDGVIPNFDSHITWGWNMLVSWFCGNFWSMLVLINDELADTMDFPDLRFLSIYNEAICNDSRLRITFKWMENYKKRKDKEMKKQK